MISTLAQIFIFYIGQTYNNTLRYSCQYKILQKLYFFRSIHIFFLIFKTFLSNLPIYFCENLHILHYFFDYIVHSAQCLCIILNKAAILIIYMLFPISQYIMFALSSHCNKETHEAYFVTGCIAIDMHLIRFKPKHL